MKDSIQKKCLDKGLKLTEQRKVIALVMSESKKTYGVSDHPDRGQRGEWLEYEEGNDPWERSKQAMCNMWEEWEGMQEIVKQESL